MSEEKNQKAKMKKRFDGDAAGARRVQGRRTECVAFKTVSLRASRVFSLGMGPAPIVSYPVGRWVRGGPHGIAAARTRHGAEKAMYFARKRKTLPIPPGMRIARILGRGVMYSNDWRLVFEEIKILGVD